MSSDLMISSSINSSSDIAAVANSDPFKAQIEIETRKHYGYYRFVELALPAPENSYITAYNNMRDCSTTTQDFISTLERYKSLLQRSKQIYDSSLPLLVSSLQHHQTALSSARDGKFQSIPPLAKEVCQSIPSITAQFHPLEADYTSLSLRIKELFGRLAQKQNGASDNARTVVYKMHATLENINGLWRWISDAACHHLGRNISEADYFSSLEYPEYRVTEKFLRYSYVDWLTLAKIEQATAVITERAIAQIDQAQAFIANQA